MNGESILAKQDIIIAGILRERRAVVTEAQARDHERRGNEWMAYALHPDTSPDMSYAYIVRAVAHYERATRLQLDAHRERGDVL